MTKNKEFICCTYAICNHYKMLGKITAIETPIINNIIVNARIFTLMEMKLLYDPLCLPISRSVYWSIGYPNGLS